MRMTGNRRIGSFFLGDGYIYHSYRKEKRYPKDDYLSFIIVPYSTSSKTRLKQNQGTHKEDELIVGKKIFSELVIENLIRNSGFEFRYKGLVQYQFDEHII